MLGLLTTLIVLSKLAIVFVPNLWLRIGIYIISELLAVLWVKRMVELRNS